MNADGSLTLPEGRLPEVVAEIERRIPYWTQKQGDDRWVMPNIVYGPGAYDAIVPTPIRLRTLSPVQALALTAAAAGCSLETIFAPVEKTGETGGLGGSSNPPPIIGYRIVLASASMSRPHRDLAEDAGPLAGVGIALSDKGGGVVVAHIIPGSPASLSPAIQPGNRILSVAEAGKQDVDVTGFGLQKVVQLIRGQPGTPVKITFGTDTDKGQTQHVASLVRKNLPVLTQETENPQVKLLRRRTSDDDSINRADDSGFSMATPPLRNNAPFVRVYALGSLISGSSSESAVKRGDFEKLVSAALQVGGVATTGKTTAKLFFHLESRVLVVNATAKEHEIIDQVIKALKENETQQTAPKKP